LLYYCHRNYEIKTGQHTVTGQGANYKITTDETCTTNGTISTIVIPDNETTRLIGSISYFAAMTNWSGKLYLNNERIKTNFNPTGKIIESDVGTVVVSKHKKNCELRNLAIIRVHGIPMYSQYISHNSLITVDLKGSYDCLLSSRDALIRSKRNEVYDIINSVVMGRPMRREEVVKHYAGNLLAGATFKSEGDCMVVGAPDDPSEEYVKPRERSDTPYKLTIKSNDSLPGEDEFGKYDFYFKTVMNGNIPDYYVPGTFGRYAKTLIEAWANALQKIHEVFEIHDAFSIGFVFDDECIAQHQVLASGRNVYFINPAKISFSKKETIQFANRFKINGDSLKGNRNGVREELVSIATHEVCHRLSGPWHNEEYSTALTNMIAKVLLNYKEIMKVVS